MTVQDLGLDARRIRAITLDLDDTLWPIWPTIERAERVLQDWLEANAPATGALCRDRAVLREVRERLNAVRPDLAHDMTALRLEATGRLHRVLQRWTPQPACTLRLWPWLVLAVSRCRGCRLLLHPRPHL